MTSAERPAGEPTPQPVPASGATASAPPSLADAVGPTAGPGHQHDQQSPPGQPPPQQYGDQPPQYAGQQQPYPYPYDGAVPGQHDYPPPYPIAEPDRLTRFVTRLYERSPRWAAPLAGLGCVAAGIGYALISDPTRSAPDAIPSCLLKLTTGLDCPGCGGTRALWFLLHGDLPDAARHHFLLIFAVPFLAYLYVAWAARQTFGWRLPELRLSSKLLGGFLAAWMVFSVARNLPWAPFTSLYV